MQNAAYEFFLKIYISLYDKHCPTVLRTYKGTYYQKPWITKGLQNACKKKNNLYKDFIKCRTKAVEKQYKAYTNKLTVIMRQAKREYYNNMLKEKKNDIKGTWKILNNVIGNKSVYTDKNKVVKNMNEVGHEFNYFFVNVGPNLAKTISKQNGKK